MLLKEMMKDVPCTLVQGSMDTVVDEVISDSRKAAPGKAFVCISGARADGHSFVGKAVEAGCKVIVAEHEVEVPKDVTLVLANDNRISLAYMAAATYDYPSEKLTVIGITGTKGKTTSAYMIRAILNAAGYKTGMIGTNGVFIGDKRYPTMNTTPESLDIQRFFHMMLEEGCTHVVMEVSSQALKLNRVAGVSFDAALYTNLSPDHIGENEHKDFDEYRECKKKLFSMAKDCFFNIDDDNAAYMMHSTNGTAHTFSIEQKADLQITKITHARKGDFLGLVCEVEGEKNFTMNLGIPGKFNASNALGAASVALSLGIEPEAVNAALKDIKIDGRMETVYTSEDLSVIVDYAHNQVSMQNLLETLRDYDPKRLVVVFGCGGNRSKLRRYEMGETAGLMADFTIITADNSRFEKVEDIIADIKIGIGKTDGKYIEIPDRREAIFHAVKEAEPGDLVAVIGKGHEDYQEIQGVRHHFLDREVVLEALGPEALEKEALGKEA